MPSSAGRSHLIFSCTKIHLPSLSLDWGYREVKSSSLPHSEVKAETKVQRTWQKVYVTAFFFLPLMKARTATQSFIRGSWGTNFDNQKHMSPEDKPLVTLIQTERYREEAIATRKQISSSGMAYFTRQLQTTLQRRQALFCLQCLAKLQMKPRFVRELLSRKVIPVPGLTS